MAKLIVNPTSSSRREIPLSRTLMSIGRDPSNDVVLPDAMVSRRHAVLFSKKKRFFIQLHPDNAGANGQPVSPLQVGDDNVTGTRELRSNDELLVGQTLLRFVTKRRVPSEQAPRPERRDR